jgi:DNA-binding transcriptional LysR family regulator
MPVVTEYQTLFTQTTVSALFVDRVVNMVDEGIDVGIRIGVLPDSSLRAIRVGRVRRVVVGAPAYLEQFGAPETPEDLRHHRLIAASGVSPVTEWRFGDGERQMAVKVQPRIQVNTNESALEAARQGFGLTRLLSYQVAPQLASGELKTVLENCEGAALPIHVIHREGRHGATKVRNFVDLIVEHLRADKTLSR